MITAGHDMVVHFGGNLPNNRSHEAEGNARMTNAAVNAFGSAAERLDLNAIELAERMAVSILVKVKGSAA